MTFIANDNLLLKLTFVHRLKSHKNSARLLRDDPIIYNFRGRTMTRCVNLRDFQRVMSPVQELEGCSNQGFFANGSEVMSCF